MVSSNIVINFTNLTMYFIISYIILYLEVVQNVYKMDVTQQQVNKHYTDGM